MIAPDSEYLVDPTWLAEHLTDADLLLVDCRFAGDQASSRQAYRDGHVPGAVHSYWLDDLCAADTRVTTLLPDSARAEAKLGDLGIGPSTMVIGYADNANLYAARLWHVLRCSGHRHVRLLDGGLDGWRRFGGQLESGENHRPPAHFRVSAPLATVIGTEELACRLDDASLQLVDARTRAEYDGTEIRAARGGHIPGAVHLAWDELTDSTGRFLPPSAIRARCAAAELDPTCETVTYCQGGVRAAHLALAMSPAGFEEVRVYDGSWAVWGNHPELPILRPLGASVMT